MVQVIRCRFLGAEVRFRFHTNSCEICRGRTDIGWVPLFLLLATWHQWCTLTFLSFTQT